MDIIEEYKEHKLVLQITEDKLYGILDGRVFNEYPALGNSCNLDEAVLMDMSMSMFRDEVEEELLRKVAVKKYFLARKLRELLNYAKELGVEYSEVSTGDASDDSESLSVMDICEQLAELNKS